MKFYLKPTFDIDNVYGLYPLESGERYEIDSQEVVIEIPLETNDKGELVESPFGVITKFDIDIVKLGHIRTSNIDWREPDDHDEIELDRINLSEDSGFTIEFSQDTLESFDSILKGIEEINIDFSTSKIYI